MRIGIDCRMAGNRHAGIGRYIAALITHILAIQPADDLVLFFRDQIQAYEVLTAPQRKLVTIVYANVRHYTMAEQLRMPGIFSSEKLDLLHVPHFNVPLLYRGKLIITIHDLLWHDYRGGSVTTLPSWLYWIKYGFYRFITSNAVARARVILVPSATVAKTVARFYPKAATKTVVTYEGVADVFKPAKESPAAQRPKELLYVGSLYPHKNLRVVFEALQELTDFTLTIVSARSVFADTTKKQVEALGLSGRVNFAGPLNDQELVRRMHQCFAVVCPSLSEGFGLPGVEGLATGSLVIASDIPIFREIYQRAALFFDPHRAASLIKAVSAATPATRSKLRTLGQKLVSRYRWSETAHATLEQYHQI